MTETTDHAERRNRYAAAMARRDGDTWPTAYENDEPDYLRRADAAIAVADAEQAELHTRIRELESMCRDTDRLRQDWVEMRDRVEELDERAKALAAATVPAPAPADRSAEKPRVTVNPDSGVILHLPEITYLDTQVWSVDIGLTDAGLESLRAALLPAPAVPVFDDLLAAQLAPLEADARDGREQQHATIRAAALLEEADRIRAHCPDHLDGGSQPGAWLVCHCAVADDMLRRLADAASGSGRADGETQQEETCTNCRGSGLDPRYNGEFACPDCPPAAEQPAAVSQPGKEA
ncbi:hypothetical protein [Streptomyces sp. NPDC088736]|uniref:hypothetical protein n=1 Tax=Streptomyces sp. NPDC088736 TaxID=3365881 RepID=UPI003819B9D6